MSVCVRVLYDINIMAIAKHNESCTLIIIAAVFINLIFLLARYSYSYQVDLHLLTHRVH